MFNPYDDASSRGLPLTLQGRGVSNAPGLLQLLGMNRQQQTPPNPAMSMNPQAQQPPAPQPQPMPQPQARVAQAQGPGFLNRVGLGSNMTPQMRAWMAGLGQNIATRGPYRRGIPAGASARQFMGDFQAQEDAQLEKQRGNQTAQYYAKFLREKGYDAEAQMAEQGFWQDAVKIAQAKGLGQKPSGASSTAGKIMQDYRNGLITKEQANAELQRLQKSGVTVNVGEGETAFAREAGKSQAKYFTDIATAGNKARQLKQDMMILDALNETGKLPERFAGYAAKKFGWARGQEAQLFESIVNANIGNFRVEGSGSQSDKEFAGILASMPSLEGNQEGRRLVARSIIRKAEINEKRAQIAQQALLGTISREDALEDLNTLEQESMSMVEELKRIVGGENIPLINDGDWKIERVGD